jgi:hypothetical protein
MVDLLTDPEGAATVALPPGSYVGWVTSDVGRDLGPGTKDRTEFVIDGPDEVRDVRLELVFGR